MRLLTDSDRGAEVASETIAAAAGARITIFDTARAYAGDNAEAGHNERLLAGALRRCGAERSARIVTKGGMSRVGGGWLPDGRAKTILADCDASLEALDGLPIDLFLIHAPDPRTPWQTSLRTLARLLDEGMVANVGLSNVNRHQLEVAAGLVDVTAIEVAVSALDDSAVRGGLVEYCAARGITVIAHSPLGGPRRARSLARRPELIDIGRARGATPEEVALAWVLDLSAVMVAIPGARRPETARSAARAAALRLVPSDRALLTAALGWPQPSGPARAAPPTDPDDGEVIVVMGVPGAGKSRHAEEYVAQGHVRLNRDQRGGSLRQLSDALDHELASGTRRIVLDNTYLSRATRSRVIEIAARHRVPVRCVWIDTPLAQAQMNLVERILDRFGSMPDPERLQELARSEAGILTPTNQMRTFRELEPPSADEGFASVQRIPFERTPQAAPVASDAPDSVLVAAAALASPGWAGTVSGVATGAPHLLFDWKPGAAASALDPEVSRLAATVSGDVTAALCPHPGGAPVCWCRPPLPGLILAFTRTHGIDPSHSVLVGTGPAHRTLATTIGARYLQIAAPTRQRA